MDNQKQIEEMARTFGGCHITPNCKVCCAYSGSTDCPNKTSAEKLYNAGYRKIPEGAVVLTQEEWATVHEQFAQAMYQKEVNTRKETAEKFAEMAKAKAIKSRVNIDDNPRNDSFIFLSEIDEICKEIVEGKV